MGLVSSGDEFCARTDKALADLPGVKKLVDDILVFADGPEELIARIRNVIKRCQEWGITLKKAKYQFGKRVEFAGYILTDEGVEPDPKKVAGTAAEGNRWKTCNKINWNQGTEARRWQRQRPGGSIR